MLTYHYRRSIIRVTEKIGMENSNEYTDKDTDLLLRYKLLFSPIQIGVANNESSFNIILPNYLVDLSKGEQEIFNNIHKNTRYKINRAMKRDEVNYVEIFSPTNEQIYEFSRFYDPFAKMKKIRKCDVNKLIAIRDQGSLFFSYATSKDNQTLCAHVYFLDDIQAYLIYSASQPTDKDSDSKIRNLIGRANRSLHWMDIMSFKNKGCNWYNFGGKVLDPNDKGGQNVNRFKEEFGVLNGYDVRSYSSRSRIGRLFLFILRLKWIKSHELVFTKEIMKRGASLCSNNKQFS